MRISRVALTLVALALGACAGTPAPLNSDRIEAQFGDYGIDVLSSGDGVRRSSLYSTDASEKITRTYAIVHFNPVPANLRDTVHARILDGGSIGTTFRSAGWSIKKQTLYVGAVNLGADVHGIGRLMQLSKPRDLAMHVYRFQVRKASQSIDYATIIELHHPEYMTIDRLRRVVGQRDGFVVDGRELEHWRSLVQARHRAAHDAN